MVPAAPTASLSFTWLRLLIFPNRHHSKPWTCLPPACQALTYYTFHHSTLEHLAMLAIFPGPVFCLLSTLVHKQWESGNHLGFDHCCPGLDTWHAGKGSGKIAKGNKLLSHTLPSPCFLLQIHEPVAVSHALCFACLSSYVHAISPMQPSQADPMSEIFSNSMPNTCRKPFLV